MKSITILILIVSHLAMAQAQGLKVGDRAPQLSVHKWIKGNPILGYKDGQIYVIEFGATWCSPCAAAIPELSAMNDRYKDQVSVVSIFVQENLYATKPGDSSYMDKVARYVKNKSDLIHYNVAMDDPSAKTEKAWLTGKQGIPHIFVIDKQGMISFIGTHPKEIYAAIERALAANNSITQQVDDIMASLEGQVKFDHTKLLRLSGNGGMEDDFMFRSIITKYDGRIQAPNQLFISSHAWIEPGSAYAYRKDRVQVIGVPLSKLYYMAYGDTLSNVVHFRGLSWEFPDTVKYPQLRTSYGRYWHEPIFELKDDSPFKGIKGSIANKYNYSLKVAPGAGTALLLQTALRNDLSTCFGYEVAVEERMMPCWKLSVLDKQVALAKLASKDQTKKTEILDSEHPFIFRNAEMRDVITVLAGTYGYGVLDYGKLPLKDQAPFVDYTGITLKIDFQFDKRWTFAEAKEYFKTLGIELTKSSKIMKVVVIRDPVKTAKR